MSRYRIYLLNIITLILLVGCAVKKDYISEVNNNPVIGSALKYDPSIPINNGDPISIIFWTQVDYEDIYRTLIDDYMEIHPNVYIELIPASFKDHFSKLQAAMTAGIGPDLFHMHNSYTDILLKHMEPYPNESLPCEILIEDFSNVTQHIINGYIYFIDTGFMTSSIFYNKKIWKEMELTESDCPKTWEELKILAKKLTIRNNNGKMIQSGFNINGQGFELYTSMNLQKGQSMFSTENKKTPILETDKSIKTLEFIKSLYSDTGVSEINFPLSHESFGTGNSAMIYSWGWTMNWLKRNSPKTDFGTFPTPTWANYKTPLIIDRNNRESSMAVSKYSSREKKVAAFDLIKYFLASNSYLLDINIQLGTIPSKKGLKKLLSEANDEVFHSFISVMNKTVWPGVYPEVYESDIVNYLIDPVIIDKKPIKQSFQELEKILIPELLNSNFNTMER